VLVSAVFEDYVSKEGISDKEIEPVYESMKPQMGGKRYKVRHILVK
jgi:peptidyl-prolyl cis-trans isomerase C